MKMDAEQINRTFEVAANAGEYPELDIVALMVNLKGQQVDAAMHHLFGAMTSRMGRGVTQTILANALSYGKLYAPVAHEDHVEHRRTMAQYGIEPEPGLQDKLRAKAADIEANGHPCHECGARPGHEAGCSQDLMGQLIGSLRQHAADVAKGGR